MSISNILLIPRLFASSLEKERNDREQSKPANPRKKVTKRASKLKKKSRKMREKSHKRNRK